MFKQTMIGITGAVALGTGLVGAAEAASFSQIYSFGDSVVDTGNAFDLTGLPPENLEVGGNLIPLYFDGNFSNGPVFTEYLAADWQLPLTNFAFGGASSGLDGNLVINDIPIAPVPGLLSQTKTFKNAPALFDPDALYVISAGANDYLTAARSGQLTSQDVTNAFINGVIGNLATAITDLSMAGAKNFLVVNQTNLGDLPLLADNPAGSALLNGIASLHNQDLGNNLLSRVQSEVPKIDVEIDILDINSILQAADSGQYEFTNTTDACIANIPCVLNPSIREGYVFWDQVHPTTVSHRIIADEAAKQVKHVPEPASTLAVLAFGAIAAGGALKKKAAA